MSPAALFVLAALAAGIAFPDPATPVYHNDALHFTFGYPSNLTPSAALGTAAMAQAGNQATGEVKQVIQCITLPFTAYDQAQTSVLLILRMDLGCLKANVTPEILAPMANSSLNQAMTKLGKPTISEPIPYQIDTHSAVLVRATAADDSGKITRFAAASCVLIDSSVVCWETMASDQQTVDAHLSGPLTFEGHPAQPLVPANLLTSNGQPAQTPKTKDLPPSTQ